MSRPWGPSIEKSNDLEGDLQKMRGWVLNELCKVAELMVDLDTRLKRLEQTHTESPLEPEEEWNPSASKGGQ